MLLARDADAFESPLEHRDVLATVEHEIWRKRGPMGKLHNLVVAFHRSDVITHHTSPQHPMAGVRCIQGSSGENSKAPQHDCRQRNALAIETVHDPSGIEASTVSGDTGLEAQARMG